MRGVRDASPPPSLETRDQQARLADARLLRLCNEHPWVTAQFGPVPRQARVRHNVVQRDRAVPAQAFPIPRLARVRQDVIQGDRQVLAQLEPVPILARMRHDDVD